MEIKLNDIYNWNASGEKLLQNITRLIFMRIFRATFYITLSLSFCIWIVKSSRYLDLLSKNNVSLLKFTELTSYLSIDIIAFLLPISLAIGSLIIFRHFKESNQLTAIMSTGISPLKLLSPLISISSLIMIYLFVSNSCFSPKAWRNFRELQFNIENNLDLPESSGVLFANNGVSAYAQYYNGNFIFKNLHIIDSRDPKKIKTYHADTGALKRSTLTLSKGEKVEIDFEKKSNSITKFDAYHYDLSDLMKKKKRPRQSNEQYLDELFSVSSDSAKKEDKATRALLHQKITSPFLALIFSLFVFMFVIFAPYSRNPKKNSFIPIMFVIIVQGIYLWLVNAASGNGFFIPIIYLFIAGSIFGEIAFLFKEQKK